MLNVRTQPRKDIRMDRIKNLIQNRPFATFLASFGIFLVLIIISNIISKNQTDTQKNEEIVKEVSTSSLKTTPIIQTQASIRKTGAITIYAQTNGIVQKVYKKEGDKVSKGTQLIWISSNYSGGTISSTQREQAELSYNYNKDNFQTQKETIDIQRELATKNQENSEELRKISEKSREESSGIIETNDKIIASIVPTIKQLEETPTPTAEQEATLNQLRAQQAQLQNAVNQLRQANRQTEYQTNASNAPIQITELQRNATYKQLDIQEKALTLQLEASRLGYKLAQIGEGLNYPASPFQGKIEQINVIPGQMINPGQALAVITADQSSATAEVLISPQLAKKISTTQPSTIYINTERIEVTPYYVSSQPTNGQMHTIKYQIPTDYTPKVQNESFLKIELPVETTNTTNLPVIPIDSIFQTQDEAYIYTAEKQNEKYIVKSKKITLGELSGSFVEVKSGLTENDIVILDRNVLEGDIVKIKK